MENENVVLAEWSAYEVPFDNVIANNHGGFISFEAIRFLSLHSIPIVWLDLTGRPVSMLLHEERINSRARLGQYRAHENPAICERIALALVKEKTRQSLNLLSQLSKSRPIEFSAKDFTVKRLSDETQTSRAYWTALGQVIPPEWGFKGRLVNASEKSLLRNAADPINALLNFGYSILAAYCRRAIYAVGLDVSLGFNHKPTAFKEGLVFDVQELFRWLIDLSVVEFLESRPELSRKDFDYTLTRTFRLKREVSKPFISAISANFSRVVPYRGRKWSYETVLYREVSRLADFVQSPVGTFVFGTPLFCARDGTA